MLRRLNSLTFAAGLIIGLFATATPAFAEGMIYPGVNGGAAPAMLSFGTKGIAFVLIWVVEAIVFRMYLNITWPRAIFGSLILNLFSALAGGILAVVAFTSLCITFLALGGFIILTYRIFYVERKIPDTFGGILLFTIGVGAFASYKIAGVVPPISPIWVWILLWLPLLTGFGIAVGLETLICSRILKSEKAWDGILKANLCSFLLCALMVPFYPGNFYDGAETYLDDLLAQRIIESAPVAEVIESLEHFAAPNVYLLGLSKDSAPSKRYLAGLERDIIEKVYVSETGEYPDPAYGLAIAENALSYPELFAESKEEMEWAKEYFGKWNDVAVTFRKGDRAGYFTAIILWTTWYQTSDVPSDFEELPDPNEIIEKLNEKLPWIVEEASTP